MTVPAHILRASLDDALEVAAAADTAKDLGIDALAGVLTHPDPHARARLLEVLRACWSLNEEMMSAAKRLSRTLDDLARAAHRSGAGTVKELAAELRPHLALIADPRDYGTDVYVDAVCALNDVIEATPFDRLAGGGMRRALGPGRHALLMGFVTGVAEPRLAQHIARVEHPASAGRAGGEACASTEPPPEGAGLAITLEEAA